MSNPTPKVSPQRGVAQRGIALLTVLLIVALASLTATQLAADQQLALRRSELLLSRQQATQFALGAEQWALAVLNRDRGDNNFDHAGENWAQPAVTLPVEGGRLSGVIEDLQGRFNLNNLLREDAVDEVQLARLRRLLEALDLDPDLAQAVADWLDPDQETRFPGGAEDDVYLAATPAYRSADRVLVDVSELRLIKGIDLDTWQKLQPYVVVLPERTAVNVNTAPAEVLTSLDPAIDTGLAQQLSRNRPWAQVEDLFMLNALAATDIQDDDISVGSRYFMASIEARVGRARVVLRSLIQRDDNGTGRVLMRYYGET